jgi:hypothetical protein
MGEDVFSLDLHPRMTVLSGLGPTERSTLAGELIGALSGERSGVHIEVRDANERRVAVLRPRGGRHRVIDVERELDVTHEFAGAGGDVDLIARAGYTGPDASRRLLVVGLPTGPDRVLDGRELELARVDQKVLWGAAENVKRTARALGAMAASANAVMSEQRLVDEVEDAHRQLEAAMAREEKANNRGFLGGALTGIAAVPSTAVFPVAAVPLLAATTLSMAWVHSARRGVSKAERLETEALQMAGAQSYLGFHLQRVNGMLSSAETRRRLATAADLHRKALAAWHGVAGDISVDWAFDHQSAIVATALVEHALAAQPQLLAPEDRAKAEALATFLTDTPVTQSDDDVLPIVLDEPFEGLDPTATRRMLGQLSRWCGLRQVIVFSGSPVVRDWAAAEATLGKVHLVEALDSGDDQFAPPTGTPTIDLSVSV